VVLSLITSADERDGTSIFGNPCRESLSRAHSYATSIPDAKRWLQRLGNLVLRVASMKAPTRDYNFRERPIFGKEIQTLKLGDLRVNENKKLTYVPQFLVAIRINCL
jgi:hypothetical protein